MPMTIQNLSPAVAAAQRLSWSDTARFIVLLLRVRRFNRRMMSAHDRVDRSGIDIAGPELVFAARRWLAAHEAIGTLLKIPEPAHVAQVRERLTNPHSRSADCA